MNACTQCGSPITDDSPQGICPRCLLSMAMQDQTAANGATLATQAFAPGKTTSTARQLGPIQLIRQIGRGGMGEVWLGRHELLGRNVAVKLLTHAVIDKNDPAFKTFLAGARVAASIEHPGLNKIFDADIEDGVPYLVLELLDGPNLAELVERAGPLDLSTARAVLEAVAGAVAGLNQRDLLHRDLKPSNIVLTTNGRVVVTDFGLACARPAAGMGGIGLAGTPAYMAPEMFDGVISAKTDVYALGMTAYHLLAGRPAFRGDVEEQRQQHREIALNVEPLRAAEVPPGVIQVIVRATSKDALFRPKSAWHVLLSLRAAFDAAGVQSATADQLAKTLQERSGQSAAAPRRESSEPSSSSLSEALSELAARKRDLRAANAASTPSPLTPPLWAIAGQRAEEASSGDALTGSRSTVGPISPVIGGRRAERRRIWIARFVASTAGTLATLLAFMLYQWIYSSLALRLDMGTRETFAGRTVPFLTLSVSSPIWARVLLMVVPFVLMLMIAVGVSTLLYRLLRGKLLPWNTENTQCGWCQHELRGITTPVCSECGHRIGDQGPDEQGIAPISRRGPRRVMGWVAYPLFFLVVIVIVQFLASLVIVGIMSAVHATPQAHHEQFVVLLISLAITLSFYEGFLQFDLTHCGRAWCRVCKGELKDLTEPICPACHTRI